MRGWFAVVSACVVVGSFAKNARADDEPAPFEVAMETNSRFVWRGLPWSRGPVVQPYVAASRFGVTASRFGSITVLRENKGDLLSAWAPSISSTWTIFGVRATTAVTAMSSVRSPSTTEVSLTCEKSFGAASVESTHAVDVGAHRGAYFGEAALKLDLALDDDAWLSTRATLAWANGRYDRVWLGVDRASMQLVGGEAALGRSVTDALDLELHAAVTTLLSPARAHAAEPTLATFGLAFDLAL